MKFGLAGLGEETLNRIAELAIASQLDEVDQLKVWVKTDLELLSQGRLASLHIDGHGLVMRRDLRLQRMRIKINDIVVSPWKALRGNIQLLEPTTGEAQIVLTEADINRAFNSSLLQPQMQNLLLPVEGKTVHLTVQQVACRFQSAGAIAIAAKVGLPGHHQWFPVAFTTTPRIINNGKAIALTDITYHDGKELSPTLTAALVEQASNILDLRNFEVEGIALQLQHLHIEHQALRLNAIAHVTHFPQA
ncbi:MAG: DUF2993 domain-containing protein [Synechococcales cyanobacterium T60_A2020_003]|nr:DUF2993 domain-containing protein [Synechococcales cyanobacterium T60_A2020_003]